MANVRLPLTRLPGRLRLTSTRQSSTLPTPPNPRQQHDPSALLAQPTWSIRTLLPAPASPSTHAPPATPPGGEEITPAQLSHLLRLSALPQPSTPSETSRMLSTLHAQLHFVRNMQQVNTDGVEPLSSIRDETPEGMREATVTPETLQAALANEDVFGRCKRPRRRRKNTKVEGREGAVEDWDVLGCAEEKVGRYFVVRSGGNGKVERKGGGGKLSEGREIKD